MVLRVLLLRHVPLFVRFQSLFGVRHGDDYGTPAHIRHLVQRVVLDDLRVGTTLVEIFVIGLRSFERTAHLFQLEPFSRRLLPWTLQANFDFLRVLTISKHTLGARLKVRCETLDDFGFVDF